MKWPVGVCSVSLREEKAAGLKDNLDAIGIFTVFERSIVYSNSVSACLESSTSGDEAIGLSRQVTIIGHQRVMKEYWARRAPFFTPVRCRPREKGRRISGKPASRFYALWHLTARSLPCILGTQPCSFYWSETSIRRRMT